MGFGGLGGMGRGFGHMGIPLGSASVPISRGATVLAWWDWRDVADGAVSSWSSRNRQAQAAIQATGTAQPVRSSTGVLFDGSDDTLTISRVTAKNLASYVVPDGSGGTAGQGFTCVGLCKYPSGWLIGNDGRSDTNDLSPEASIVITDSNWTKTGEILLVPIYGSSVTVQGVAYDESDNTIWFADTANSIVRHLTLAGVDIPGDAISLAYAPNGLARWPSSDCLLVGAADSATLIEQRSCVDGSLVSSRTVPVTQGRDHFWFDDDYDVLGFTAGVNSTDGLVYYYSWDQQNAIGSRVMTGADAIEGISTDKSSPWRVTLTNDGRFHATPSGVNARIEFETAPAYPTKMVLAWVGKGVTITASSTKGLVCVQDPVVGQGIALCFFSSTEARLLVNTTPTGTTEQVICAATSLTLTSETRIIGEVDTVADTAKIYVNGVLKNTVDASVLKPLLPTGGQIDIGRIPSGTRFTNQYTKIAAVIAGGVDIAALDSFLAAQAAG